MATQIHRLGPPVWMAIVKKTPSQILKNALTAAGVDAKRYAWTSIRKGGATRHERPGSTPARSNPKETGSRTMGSTRTCSYWNWRPPTRPAQSSWTQTRKECNEHGDRAGTNADDTDLIGSDADHCEPKQTVLRAVLTTWKNKSSSGWTGSRLPHNRALPLTNSSGHAARTP